MPGLQRAFLRAGAHGVIATLWPVEDVYASQFAADFYRRYTAGESAAAALAGTQREWAQPTPGISATEQVHRRLTAWAHAFYTRERPLRHARNVARGGAARLAAPAIH